MQMLSDDGRQFYATVSIGMRKFQVTFSHLDDLLAAADAILYLAKSRSRDRVEVYESA
jgi:PleD family two-component response regulator